MKFERTDADRVVVDEVRLLDGRSPWSLWAVAAVLIGSLFLSSAAVGIWVLLTDTSSSTTTLGSLCVGTIGLWVAFGGGAALLALSAMPPPQTWRQRFHLLGFRRVGFNWLASAFGLGLACQLIGVNVIYLPLRFFAKNEAEKVDDKAREIYDLAHGYRILVIVFVVGIGAPIFEELFFRGLLARSVRRHVNVWWSVVISGLIFGLFHFQLLQFPALALFGMLLAFVMYKTNSLWTNISCHMGFNLATVALLYLQNNVSK